MGITIYPSKELRKKIERISKKERRSMNNLILFIIEGYIENQREKTVILKNGKC